MKKQQSGFTLIELVVVIVVLGLLAATALPKYINITSDARRSSVNGVAGGLRAAAALGQAQYVVNGNVNASTISMGAQTVTVLQESAAAGRGGNPTADATGIRIAMPDPAGFAAPAISGTGIVYFTNNYANVAAAAAAPCTATYDPNSLADVVVTSTGGC